MPIDSGDIELGVCAGPAPWYVDADEVAAYALAINDPHPRYLDGTAVPPTYVVVPSLPVVHDLPAFPPAVLGAARAHVHAEHDLVVHRPVVAGTWIHTAAERVGVMPTRAGMLVEQVVRAVDDDGVLLVEQHWVTMLVGDAVGSGRGTQPPEHSIPVEARQQPVGRLELPTTRDQTFRYAKASGDHNPMHLDDEVARGRGFPRQFNQGLCTVGIATRGLIDMVAGSHPTRMTRIAVRFAAPAFPGDDVAISVYALGETAEGRQAYAFEADSSGRTVLGHGRCEIDPDQSR